MNQHNWIITDDVASSASFAGTYRLGKPVNSNLIFPEIEDNVREDTGLLDCVARIAVITPMVQQCDIDLHIAAVGYRQAMACLGAWYIGDPEFFRKVDNVIIILNGVATYLKRPYTQPKREPVPNYRLETATPLVFQAELGKRLKARQPVLEMLVHPVTSPQALRG